MEKLIFEIFFFVLGASIGSFLNVLIDRLPHNETLMGRSNCDHCGKKIAWYDLIPIFSFFFLRGKCRYCHKKLSWQYPLVEIFTGVTYLLTFLSYQPIGYIKLSALLGIFSCLIVIFVSDWKYHLISDYLLIFFAFFSFVYRFDSFATWKNFLINNALPAIAVSLPIFLIYFLSRERAMGLGDVYLTAIMGFLLGIVGGYVGLYIAFLTGALVGILLIMSRKKKVKSQIAFGPFLAMATVVVLVWGHQLTPFIIGIFGF